MFSKSLVATAVCAALLVSTGALADTITKAPDIGNWWNPLGQNGTTIYANSFVATQTGLVTEFGLWLFGGPADLRFQIYSSLDNLVENGPDSSSALVTSNVVAGQSYGELTYVSANPVSGTSLTAGETYWFAATANGLSGTGAYTVGGHTQNSGGIVDNGTFWFSNASDGSFFDGQAKTPEMAFQVTIDGPLPVPEPETYAMLLAGLGIMGAVARRRKAMQS